ncbi:MAG: DUF1330 domain-containing protein [Maricaulaceae bacterium]
MSAYVLAQLEFVDIDRYRTYQAAFASVFEASGAKLLIADEHPTLLEGEWLGDKVVLMEFPDERQAMSWLQSPEYQVISEDRKAGARTTALLLRGFGV